MRPAIVKQVAKILGHLGCARRGVLDLSRALFGERPWQHELGFEDCPTWFHHPIEGGSHPLDHRMVYPPLNVLERVSGIALVPMPVEMLGHDPELDNEIAGEILGLGFTALLAPEADKGIFIFAHDDASIRTADKILAISGIPSFR